MQNILFIFLLLVAIAVKFVAGTDSPAALSPAPVSAPAPNALPNEADPEPAIRPDTQPLRPAKRPARLSSKTGNTSLPHSIVFLPASSTAVSC